MEALLCPVLGYEGNSGYTQNWLDSSLAMQNWLDGKLAMWSTVRMAFSIVITLQIGSVARLHAPLTMAPLSRVLYSPYAKVLVKRSVRNPLKIIPTNFS